MSRAVPAEREPLLTAAFLTLWLVGFFQEMSWGLMIHLPGYLRQLGATEASIGLVYASGAIVALALRPVMGRAIDQWGRKLVFVTGGLVLTASIVAYIPLASFGPLVFLVRMVHSSVEIMLFTTLLAFGADLVPVSRRTQGLALLGISGLLPIGLGSILGDVVLAGASYDRVLAFSAALALTSWAFAWRLPAIPPVDPHREQHRGFRLVAVQRDLRPVWLLTLGFALGITTLFTFTRTYVDVTGIGSVGLYFGVYAFVAILVRIFGSGRADRRGAHRVLVPAMVFYAAQFVVLAVTSSTTGMVFAGGLGGLGHGLLFPIITTLVVSRATDEERGTALAVFSGLLDLVTLVAAPLAGALIVASGYGVTYAVIGLVILGALVGFLAWDPKTRPTGPAS